MQATHYKMEEVIENAENLSYMPTTVLKLLETISARDVTVSEIVAIIEKDQGLVARVFKVANSSFYGRLKKAVNVTEAVVTLGLRGLKSFVITQAVKHVLTTADVEDNSLWEHGVKVSITSSVLAKELRCNVLEDALLSGLVHDIGKAFIVSVYPEIPSIIHQKVLNERITYDEAEQLVLNFNHAEVGALITEKWGFPPTIVDVIRHHHKADDIPEVCTESQEMIHIVKFADVMSKQFDAQPESCAVDMLENVSYANLHDLSADRLAHLMEEVKKRWKLEGENDLLF